MTMSDDLLLEELWLEKRGKIIPTEKYTTGVNISVDSFEDFDYASFAADLVSFLHTHPEQGYDWSKNWGRAICTVHPDESYAIRFSEYLSHYEKQGAMIMSSDVTRPEDVLHADQFREGYFSLFINNTKKTKESLLIQIERMIDELIWSLSRCIEAKSESNNAQSYLLATKIVLSRGFKIVPASQNDILSLRRTSKDIHVRIYGDVMGKGKLPQVLGAVDARLFDSCLPNYFELDATKVNEVNRERVSLKCVTSTASKRKDLSLEGIRSVVAFTAPKKLQLWHVMQAAYARLVSNFGENGSFYVDFDDTSPRALASVETIAGTLESSVDDVVVKLSQNDVDTELIALSYGNRDENADTAHLQGKSLFGQNIEEASQALSSFGIDHTKLLASDRFELMNEIINSSQVSNDLDGFSFSRIDEKGSRRVVVLEKEGVCTASLARASAMQLLATEDSRNGIAYVDYSPSVRQAVSLVNANYPSAIGTSFEGVGIGLEDTILSTTIHSDFEIDWLQQQLMCTGIDVEDYFSFLLFWIFSRKHVFNCERNKAFERGTQNSESFILYKDKPSIERDIDSLRSEYEAFKSGVNQILERLEYVHRPVSNDDRVHQRLIASLKNKTVGSLFPKSEYVIPNQSFKEEYRRLRRNSNVDGDLLIQEVLQTTELNYVTFLQSQGFDGPTYHELITRFLTGDLCMVRRRCKPFELLQDLVVCCVEVDEIRTPFANEVRESIECVMRAFQLST